jgi:cytochrome c553
METPLKQRFIVSLGFLILIALIVIITFRIALVQRLITDNNGKLSDRIAAVESSIISLDKQVGFLRDQVPGLGQYMTGLQLHMAKIWFAARASNWNLANYELHEISETIDTVAALNISRNDVDISEEIKGVFGSQVFNLQKAIKEHNLSEFTASYNEALTACNDCHGSAGYRFIHITIPSAPPVTNQLWEEISTDK